MTINKEITKLAKELKEVRNRRVKLLDDIMNHYHYFLNGSYTSEKTLVQVIYDFYRGSTGYHSDNNVSVIKTYKGTSMHGEAIIPHRYRCNHTNRRSGNGEDQVTITKFSSVDLEMIASEDSIRQKWLERLNNGFDRKIEDSLSLYTDYLKTLSTLDLLNEFDRKFEVINLPKFKIRNWIIIKTKCR